jgi:transposase InsO family protein
MSLAISPLTGRPHGLQRMCRILDQPRSTIYAKRARQAAGPPDLPRMRRGPQPRLADEALTQAIRDDLATSQFTGEGHRKVWNRLRLAGIRVSRDRVLRLMREHHLLSPHRHRQGKSRVHTGTITTLAPDLMWGTDGVRVETVDEGWVWIFCAVDHFNAECIGWHVAKIGSRFAALEPLAQGLTRYFGGTGAQAARGLALRFDHGTQYMSDHFLNQLRFWGVAASPAFVAEPQTNGAAERFNLTLKQQAIHGHVFRNVEELRHAVADFVDRYNAHWRLEKLGYLTPFEARQAATVRQVA